MVRPRARASPFLLPKRRARPQGTPGAAAWRTQSCAPHPPWVPQHPARLLVVADADQLLAAGGGENHVLHRRRVALELVARLDVRRALVVGAALAGEDARLRVLGGERQERAGGRGAGQAQRMRGPGTSRGWSGARLKPTTIPPSTPATPAPHLQVPHEHHLVRAARRDARRGAAGRGRGSGAPRLHAHKARAARREAAARPAATHPARRNPAPARLLVESAKKGCGGPPSSPSTFAWPTSTASATDGAGHFLS